MAVRGLVIDSSVWIEVLGQGPLSKVCKNEVQAAVRIGVPTLVMFEVYKKIAIRTSEHQALSAIAMLSQYETLELTRDVSLAAADISIQEKLAMADSIVLAHARMAGFTLLTLDNDFADVQGARVLRGT